MVEAKQQMFLLSWAIGLVSLLSVTLHCWTTRGQKQPWLLASKVFLAVSIALAVPYTWDLQLQRYRLLGNIVIYVLCASVLATAFF